MARCWKDVRAEAVAEGLVDEQRARDAARELEAAVLAGRTASVPRGPSCGRA